MALLWKRVLKFLPSKLTVFEVCVLYYLINKNTVLLPYEKSKRIERNNKTDFA